jgi:cyclase
MKKLILLSALISIANVSASAHGNDSHFGNKQEVTVKVTKVSGNVHMLQGRGGNIAALTGAEGILIVDDDYRNVSGQLREALKSLGSEAPRFILNTHWHGDHTEGNEVFGKTGTIVAHANVRKRLLAPPVIFGRQTPPYPSHALPIVTYTQELSIHLNGEEIRAVHYPTGHTDGDTVVYFTGANVAHLGDHFFVNRFPFIDLDSGGSVQGFINNVDAMIRTMPPNAKIIPGHGPLATIDDLRAFHQTLTETTTIIQNAIKAGKSLDDIKKAGLPEKYKEAGSGFINTPTWIDIVHRSYSRR